MDYKKLGFFLRMDSLKMKIFNIRKISINSVIILFGLMSSLRVNQIKAFEKGENQESLDKPLKVIALDQSGHPIEIPIGPKFLRKKLQKTIEALTPETIQTLDSISMDQDHHEFKLSTVEVRVDLQSSLGIGKYLRGHFEPHLRLFFARDINE